MHLSVLVEKVLQDTLNHPVSGDASQSDARSKSFEIKYQSDMDGMFNFLIGAIDISNSSSSFYDVYATGITMNGLDAPGFNWLLERELISMH